MFGPSVIQPPQDVVRHILSYLTPAQLCLCQEVNQIWKKASCDESLWQAIYKEHYPDKPLPQGSARKYLLELWNNGLDSTTGILKAAVQFMQQISWIRPSGIFEVKLFSHRYPIQIFISSDKDPDPDDVHTKVTKYCRKKLTDGSLPSNLTPTAIFNSVSCLLTRDSKHHISEFDKESSNMCMMLCKQPQHYYCRLNFPKDINKPGPQPCDLEQALRQLCMQKIDTLAKSHLPNALLWTTIGLSLLASVTVLTLYLALP